MLISFLQRIPTVWIAMVLTAFAAWLYVRWLTEETRVRQVLLEQVSGTALVFLIFSRFGAGLLLHPSLNVQEDFLSMVSGDVTYGWLVGLVAAGIYVGWGWRKAKLPLRPAFAATAEAVAAGSVMFFAYFAAVDAGLLQSQDFWRVVGSVGSLLLVRRSRRALTFRPQWAWVGLGSLYLVTSAVTPPSVLLGVFTPQQWFLSALVLSALGVEAFDDFGRPA